MQQQVKDFDKVFHIKERETPGWPDPDSMELGLKLIAEEASELEEAVLHEEFSLAIDALADLLYETFQLANKCGVALQPIFEEVHKANMKKLDKEGRPIRRKDGKILKPKGWEHPDILKLLQQQGYEGE
jgi:predicted HAD superfamily Cof-like phosphohydrolase